MLVGGKVEAGESLLNVAYRELQEETGISISDIQLTHLMNFQYIMLNYEIEVFAGRLKYDMELIEEANKLFWLSVEENFYDNDKFAGEGNIGHMLAHAKVVVENMN